MLFDIVRFHRDAPRALDAGLADTVTATEFGESRGYGRAFVERYFVPLGASLWSCPAERFAAFPARFVLEFLRNHSMLQVDDRPVWRTVRGGSSSYIEPLCAPFRERIHLGAPVEAVRRGAREVRVRLADGREDGFDEVVLATHADQSLAMVEDLDRHEREVLGFFPYQDNDVALHDDTGVLPESERVWASWNYRVPAEDAGPVSVTYHMNQLQGLDTERNYCVTLNPNGSIRPERIIRRLRYSHPVFVPGRASAQEAHCELVRRRGISYCGAYWGYGFHEDGVNSALAVAAGFGAGLDG
jgi:predicted NAD/FAD-binding protein